MPKPRSYRLLCPIARALDAIGDRWALLILRDLHAGPARFNEIAAGLPGLASNLLTSRLEELQMRGLVEHVESASGAMVYALTPDGDRTGPVLFELARFGALVAPPEDLRKPANLRTVVVTLREALRRVTPNDLSLDLELSVDDEAFGIRISEGRISVTYGRRPEAPTAVRTDYGAFIGVGDGRLSSEAFAASHVEVLRGDPSAVAALFDLLGRAFRG